MVVYWDLAAAWNFALDYILLLCAVRLAGLPPRRARLALGAALGAAYAVAALLLSLPGWLLLPAMAAMCLAAFGRTARTLRLTLLFALLSCALGGAVLLLGRATGNLARLRRGIVYAQLPWGVFFAALALSYLLLTLVFRGGARHAGGELLRARIEYGGRSAELTLLRDTGNTLTDPLTGAGVPVIERTALLPLFPEEADASGTASPTLRVRTVSGGDGALPTFRCDNLVVNGIERGPWLVAVTEETFRGGCAGLWFDEEREGAEQYEMEASVG